MTKTLKPAGLLVAFLLTGCLGGGSTPTATTAPANSQTTPPPAAAASDPFKGTYNGVLPCADCDGLQTSLTLDGAGNYTIQSTKLKTQKTTPPVASTATLPTRNTCNWTTTPATSPSWLAIVSWKSACRMAAKVSANCQTTTTASSANKRQTTKSRMRIRLFCCNTGA